MSVWKEIFCLLLLIFAIACSKDPAIEMTCPANTTVEIPYLSVPSKTIDLPVPTVNSDCGDGQYSLTNNLPDTLHTGEYFITYIASNNCDNQSTCSFLLTVVSNPNIQISCPINMTIDIPNSSVPTNTIVLPSPTVVSNCEDDQYLLSTNLPDTLHPGGYTITYNASNDCGNQTTCSFILIVVHNPSIKIICPSNVIVQLPNVSAPANTIVLPDPEVISNCIDDSFALSTDLPQTLIAGEYTVTYHVSDLCGNQNQCTFQLTALDYRTPFIGTYTGIYNCWTAYPITPYLDTILTVHVDYGNTPNTLLVDDDLVPIDSTGSCPYINCCSYRLYNQRFEGDSLFIYRQWGALNSNTNCRFKGRKL